MLETSEKERRDVVIFGHESIRPLAFGGHCYWVRKCMTGRQVGNDKFDRMVGLLFVTQGWAERSLIVEVLAIGPRVGKPCAKRHMHYYKRAKYLEPQVEVGDLLLCPDDNHPGIKVVPGIDCDYLIEEGLPLAIYKGDEDGNGTGPDERTH